MNRSQLREAVYNRIGVDSTDGRMTTTVLDGFINDALHWVETERAWPWLQATTTITTVAGDGDYAVPSDWLKTRYLRIDEDSPFQVREIGELELLYPDASETGQPREYAIEGDAVLVRPIPDGVYTIVHRYIKRESDLTSDGQSPLMPASFHTIIVAAATYLALRSTRENERAALAWQEYQEWRQRMLDDARRTTRPARIKTVSRTWSE